MKIYLITILLFLTIFSVKAQIVTQPVLPIANQEVTITFNSANESRLGYYTGDLYAHTGVTLEGKGAWQNVIGSWGINTTQPKLTHKGNGIYELKITPSINAFYSVGSNDVVTQLCMVFRGDNSKQTNDLLIDVFQPGISISIQFPSNGSILEPSTPYLISANSTESAALKLSVDGVMIKQASGTTISSNHTFTNFGEATIVAVAEKEGETVTDTATIFIRSSTVEQKLPEGSKKGIAYIDNTTARLVLWAPKKSFVFLLGDFNNWEVSNEYQMKKDGDYFWFDVSGLTPAKEYAFQYFVEGNVKIADPYTNKISDPWNDQYITSVTYPNLLVYPKGKTEGIASVLQTAQQSYSWQTSSFTPPIKEKMVIYELLVRDFTAEHSYKAVIEQLDYLQDLHINVLELMPVNEFEGNSSWGYNPSFYFAADKYYGPANDLKQLIDECHKRGIAVVIDMVLNHSYSQSPFAQLYMNNSTVTADNPWYNAKSNFLNTSLNWGYDFNHESAATRELVDSINSYWLTEFKVDGFRFDFTKGFSNTPYPLTSWGSEYDASRIANLKRMADHIWELNSKAMVICEHLADNSEEKVLADYGLMLWGNMNNNYGEAAMGYNESGKSDLTWGVYKSRTWNSPNLVTYQESHDEERLAFKCKTWGNAVGDYDIKKLETITNRLELTSVFHLPLPGPKMIWQFGELAYDISIDFNGRVGEKPLKWDYLDNEHRTDLFRVMAKLNYLKQNYDEFSATNMQFSLAGEAKWYRLSANDNHVVVVGNFGTTSKDVTVNFPVTGTWYNYFGETTMQINQTATSLSLQPGEFLLLSTRQFQQPDITTEFEQTKAPTGSIHLYPNPTSTELFISGKELEQLAVYNVTGEKVGLHFTELDQNHYSISIEGLEPGLYFLIAKQTGQIETVSRFLKK